ncbi:hypothetical protein [uncultured Nevskia sp.]|uniref:hypothetical protein n=1 Tax=uncultured Nevskia sp. TaxID=228950 RepID=UPI0025D2A08E|nr:hypothetical protein [uncultured Nevskia sp.]
MPGVIADSRHSRIQDLLRRFARNEARAIDGHRQGLQERWQIIRRSRRPGETLRYQIDLLPRTAKRVIGDHRRRLALVRALLRSAYTSAESPQP